MRDKASPPSSMGSRSPRLRRRAPRLRRLRRRDCGPRLRRGGGGGGGVQIISRKTRSRERERQTETLVDSTRSPSPAGRSEFFLSSFFPRDDSVGVTTGTTCYTSLSLTRPHFIAPQLGLYEPPLLSRHCAPPLLPSLCPASICVASTVSRLVQSEVGCCFGYGWVPSIAVCSFSVSGFSFF